MVSVVTPVPPIPLLSLVGTPIPIYIQALAEPTKTNLIVSTSSVAPLCDSAPPTPLVPIQTSISSPIGTTTFVPLVQIDPETIEGGMMSFQFHQALFHQYQWL